MKCPATRHPCVMQNSEVLVSWRALLRALELGIPIPLSAHGLALVPIHRKDPSSLAASLLAEALGHGEAMVTEVGQGQVNTVRVEHRGLAPLLLLDGEEVIGAKQNRVFNASFLVAPGSTVEVPVSCVEK